MTLDAMRDFRISKAEGLLDLLTSKNVHSKEEAEAIVHALVDIAESVEDVYCNLIPKVLSEPEASVNLVKERLWDIREEFRHIDYHVHDGKLTEL